MIGCGQMIWIAVQLTIIDELSFLHPTMFGVGLVIAAASVVWAWPLLRAIVGRLARQRRRWRAAA